MNSGSIKRIDELGRIVIPKDIRKRLSIKTNDSLEISVENNNIKISKSKSINNFDEFIIKLLKIICKNLDYKLIATNRDAVIFNNTEIEIDIKNLFLNNYNDLNMSVKPLIIDSNIEGFILVSGSNCNDEIAKILSIIIINFIDISC